MKDLRTQHWPKSTDGIFKKNLQLSHNVKDILKFILGFYALFSEKLISSLSQEKGQLLRWTTALIWYGKPYILMFLPDNLQ